MLSPPLSTYTIPSNQIVAPFNDAQSLNNRPSCQTSIHQQIQNSNEKHQILLGNQSPSNSLAILDLKQSAKSIGDTLIYIFSQFIDHIYSKIKDQWASLKTLLQPFNQQKVTDFFSKQKQRIVSKSNSSHQSYSQPTSDNIFSSNSIPLNNITNNNRLNNNSNDISIDVMKPIKSMPTSTRNHQSVGNPYIPNSNEILTNFNDIMKSINSTSVQTSSNTNIFLNNCQSPSAPSLLPTSSTHNPSSYISQQNNAQNNINNNQSVNSSDLFYQLQSFQGISRDDTSPQPIITSVSRCNSFTTTNYPNVSNFDHNNNSSVLNNQSLNCVKRDNTPNQQLCSQQGISMISRNKKESAWSQFKAVPISTFKLDVPRTNKHMHQLSSTTQYGSQTNINLNENEQTISPFNTQGQQQNYLEKRGSSQQQTKLQSLTNYQQHHTFIQQQKESLVRQASVSQERSAVTKLICENKPQSLELQLDNDLSQRNQQLLQSQGNNQLHRANTQQFSPKLQRQTQQLGILLSQNSQQNITYNSTQSNNVTLANNIAQSNNISQNNLISINCIKQPNKAVQQQISNSLQDICLNSPSDLQVNQSINASQKTQNQTIQSSSNLTKPLQGITVSQNNTSLQNFTQQKLILSSSNSRNQLIQPPNNLISSHQGIIYAQEASKENDRYAYLFTKENDINKDFSDQKNFFDNSKNHQSVGKPFQKISQNKVINLNSYQVPSQYGQKQNIENCISPTKLQQQHSKSFQNTKNLFQSPTQQGTLSIQNLNNRVNTEVIKVNRFRTETDSKNKTNTIEQFLSTQASDQTYEASSYSQTHRSQSKYSTHNASSSFQSNLLKQKVSKLMQISEENNIKIKAFNLK